MASFDCDVVIIGSGFGGVQEVDGSIQIRA